jgi:hypothetical protein
VSRCVNAPCGSQLVCSNGYLISDLFIYLFVCLFVIDGWTKQVDEMKLIHDLALLPSIL